ncbi:MAG: NAD(P)/FAD-dependent oxidoreductase [Chitinophagaceae bacterium]|nr:NAD(P)/FAD-dependent oxidoreductase [Chitinophagaceae bacterium]MBL0055104.1 NAD(P)/FAD-dependent oxidoreductase [Chitinophagaceae bacterium]
MQPNEYDTIIIGSGAGGLSAAICLARAGQKVAVIEQHYVPGGWCHSFYLNGHRFSPGVHYIGSLDKGQSTSRLYEGLGIGKDLVFFRMNPAGYEHCWIGNEKIDMPATPARLYESLSERFPKEKKGLKKYLALIQKVSKEIQLISTMNGFWDNVTIAYRTRHLGKYGLFSLKRVVGWHIKDPLLQKVINIQCGDHGLPPSKASFPLHCALMDHYINGGFYPMGGGGAIVKAMTNAIKKQGGEVKTGQSVKSILLEPGSKKGKWKATGIELQNGERLLATQVISNADPTATYGLVGMENLSDKLKAKLAKTKYSVTSLMFFLTVEMDVRKAGLDSGNIWLMPDCEIDDVYNDLTSVDILASDEFPSLFISCSSLKDPTSFNGRQHTIEVVTFINYDAFKDKLAHPEQLNGDYKKFKEKLCDKLVNTLNRIVPGIKDHIIHLELGTPTTNEFYIKSTRGNVYGTEKGFFQTGPFSYSAQTEIEQLYMCGASIMAHGVSGSSYSGVKTAAMVLKCKEEDLIREDPSNEVRVYDADDDSNWPEWLRQKIAERKKRTKSAAQPVMQVPE